MQPCTHGNTYLEAIQNAQEAIKLLVETAIENHCPNIKNFKQFQFYKLREFR
jgi:predicted RNase H-like HicB family nuclease